MLTKESFWGTGVFAAAGLSHFLIGDQFWVVIWFAQFWATWRSSTKLAHWFSDEGSLVTRCILGVFFFQVIASVTVSYLGIIGLLSPFALLAVTGVVYVAVSLAVHPASERSKSYPSPWCIPKLNFAQTTVTIFCVMFCILLAVNLIRYPTIDSDNMWYHLPMVAEWQRTGSIWPASELQPREGGEVVYSHVQHHLFLTEPDGPVKTVAIGYPGHREAVCSFLALSARDEHLGLIGAVEPLFLGLIVFSLARKVSGHMLLPYAAAAYAISMPIVTGGTKGNDLALTIALLCSLHFLVDAIEAATRKSCFLAGLALGMLIATKYSGVILAPVTCLAAIACGLQRLRGQVISLSQVAHWLLWLVIGVFVVPFPWYLRNCVLWKNPIYPAKVEILGVTVFEGPFDRKYLSQFTLGTDIVPLIEHWDYFIDAFGGLGLVFLAVPLISLLYLSLWRSNSTLIPLATLLSFAYLGAFLNQPYNRPTFVADYNMRYLIHWVVIGLILMVGLVRHTNRPSDGLSLGLLFFAVLGTAKETHYWWLIVLLALALACAYYLLVNGPQVQYLFMPRTAFVLAWLLVPGLVQLVHRYNSALPYENPPSSRGWAELANFVHTELSGRTIAILGDDRFFPFYGSHFENKVLLAPPMTSSKEVLSFCEKNSVTHLVTLRPILERSGARDYSFGQSLGQRLLDELEGLTVILEANGAYLLELKGKSFFQDATPH